MPQCVNLQFDMLKDSPMHFFPLSSYFSYQHSPKAKPCENVVMFETSSIWIWVCENFF